MEDGVIGGEIIGHGRNVVGVERGGINLYIGQNTFAGEVVFAGGQIGGGSEGKSGGSVLELIDGLDEGFTEGFASDNGGALVVFEGGGEDFGGTGGMFVHEESEGQLAAGVTIVLGTIGGSTGSGINGDNQALIQEQTGSIDSGM